MATELTPEELQQAEALRQGFLEMEEKDPSWMERVSATAGAVASDVGTGLKEAVPQAVRGAQEGLNAMSDATFSVADWLNKNVIDLDKLVLGREAPNENALRFSDGAMPAEPESVTGTIVNDVTQFLVGMGVAGRALKAVGVTRAVTAPGAVGQGMLKGAIADATAFDPHEERLSNLLEQYPRLSNSVTQYLAADPEDGEAEGRLKNALEGLVLGGLVESLFHGIRAIKLKRSGNLKGAEEALDEMERSGEAAGVKVDEAPLRDGPEGGEQLDLNLEGGGPRPDSPRETFGDQQGDVKPGDMAADVPPKKPTKDAPAFKPAKKLVEVDDAKLREIAGASISEKAWGQGRNISGIRTDLMETAEDINATMSALRVVYREEAAKAIGGNADNVRSWKNVERNADSLADLIGDDPRLLLQRMQAIHKETFHADAELKLYRDMLVTVNDRLVQIAEVVGDPLGGTGKYASRAEAYADFAKHYELMANMQLMYKGIQTNFARTMNAMKLTAEARKGVLPDNVDGLFAGGEREIVKAAKKILANGENVKGNLQITRGGFVNKMLSSVNEYWINSILSGPKTHVVNITSNAINAAFIPTERLIAGALHFDSPQGRAEFIEGALQFAGYAASFKDAVQLAYKALKTGESILDPARGTVEHAPAISNLNYGISDPALSMAINGLGNVVRLPSRFLTAEDEFFKQLTYRSAIRAQAWREAATNGMWRDPKAMAEHVTKRLDEAVEGNGNAKNADALALARETTFTQDLAAATHSGGRTLGQTLQGAAAAHPGLRLIMPFVRTPTNIMRQVWNHTPGLNLLRKQYADDIMGANGFRAKARAQAQMLTGGLLWGAAVANVMEGNITGGGPADPDIRKALEATGWRPYSIRTTDEEGNVHYTSYARFDPFGMFFGLAADYAEAAGAWPEQDLEERATMVVTALAKNLNNKSYLSGLVNALGAMSEPGRKAENFFKGIAGGFVPTALQQVAGDPHMREARSVVDAMRRKMPGYAEDLDPQRNILGEKQYIPPALGPDWISPVTQTVHAPGAQPLTDEWKRTPQSDVYDELARQMMLHNSAIKVSPDKLDGVDLTQYRSPVTGYTASDRYRELTGTVEINGKTLKETLADFFASPAYKTGLSDGDFDRNGSRIDQIRVIVQAFREAAKAELRQEIPQLHYDLMEAQRQGALIKLPQDQRSSR
ncbi:hypothetical protein Ga0061061_1174 [Chelatococcus sambhunathii]|uniref:Large polyvalent protein associated domain-containing protein n=1 Tax=Chelatococcus sambhunathii TaxID=363953 RepID=A0ABM9UE81_9HYPH|nr:hypothetical protein [Chelatococcus sambhunathii]CUA90940.1 hypothetical protein Ga0061061_1174 [Chelatococcus sambhunathii]